MLFTVPDGMSLTEHSHAMPLLEFFKLMSDMVRFEAEKTAALQLAQTTQVQLDDAKRVNEMAVVMRQRQVKV